ncbi:Cytoplasmic GTPase/eEF2-like protein (ribosomal bioproteinsis) [Puccinia graminis f. sp. tritici]|uniref:Ribosome assembly protein 1 n=1 Tax=Puccinia graminis f. sp. tritici TaxID=56615 RepID=A0A5B0N6L9_PUCGR|nr:Cytoplasmic GTPase/eEF2-like protein (ribosomal bioproteinsis) [Puccinia graminis f. sp. tritici]
MSCICIIAHIYLIRAVNHAEPHQLNKFPLENRLTMASTSASAIPHHRIRNVCILAHVDHGKSSYADSLLAANNIITPKMAGKLRYLDSRPDEQERGITMKSSAVSLSYATIRLNPAGLEELEQFRINLIDTPGHVDFTTEVSTASRLCDGALVLVDVVEGVCTQTISVLRQVWNEQLKPILVINKVDRLIVELRLSPTEAYYHLVRLVEQVNAIMGSFFFTDRMEQDLRWREAAERSEQQQEQQEQQSSSIPNKQFTETDDQDIYFDPTKGDVIFSSAIDNWSFNIASFAALWSKKLGIEQAKLESCLWGDFFFDPKSKKVLNKKQANQKGSLKPMFVQFVLDNLWAVYDSVILNPDSIKTEKIIQSLGLKIRLQDLKSKDSKNLLLAICSQWLPISNTTFRTIVAKVPDPITSQSARLPKMLYPYLPDLTQAIPHSEIERDLYAGKSDDSSHVVIYVSKMFAVPISELPQFQRKQLTAEEMREKGRAARVRAQAASATHDAVPLNITASTEIVGETGPVPEPPSELPSTSPAPTPDDPSSQPEDSANVIEEASPEEGEALIGFARIYSGTVKVNQKLTCVLPKYNSTNPTQVNSAHLKTVTIENLYIIMGRSLVETSEVRAGHVFGIGGLAGKVLRNATLCGAPVSKANQDEVDDKLPELINLAGVQLASAPIVRVSLEPKQPSDMPKLVEGLKILNQSDPCVETLIQDTGEHVILTAGELHLERCLRDLRERFAKIRIQASKPIVPFRETAVRGVDMPPPKTKDQPRGTISGTVLGGLISFTVRAIPLPEPITSYLAKHSEMMRKISLRQERKLDPTNGSSDSTGVGSLASSNMESMDLMNDVQQYDQTANLAQASNNNNYDSVFWSGLEDACKSLTNSSANELDFDTLVDSIWAFGPKRSGPNLLLDKLPGSIRSLRKPNRCNSQSLVKEQETEQNAQSGTDQLMSMREFDDSIETAFQLATFKGPLCAEPMSGMCFSIEDIQIGGEDLAGSVETIRARWSQLTGELISSVQEAFRSAFLDWSPRLMLAMYTCEIQATTEVLGKVYGVIARRKGVIKSEEIKDGTTFYTIGARLPIIESFGFNDELMKKTSGIALPQLIFDGFEILVDLDPFWIPKTDEELEDFGALADKENLPRKYIDQVRKRKGMFVEKKIVQHAEKQRTMKR